MPRVGQNQIHTVYVQYIWQQNHQIYGHTWCIYTVLANPAYACCRVIHTMDGKAWCISRAGQNRIYTYIYTVYLVISKPKVPYIHRIHIYGSGQPYA